MKVAILAPTPPPAGGIAGWTKRMMNASLKDGWSVVVVDEKPIGKRQVFGKAGRPKITEEIVRNHKIWSNLKRVLRDPEVKVVHSCIPSTTFAMLREFICACITKKRKRKFIIHFRCTVPNTTQGRIGRIVLKILCNKSDMIFSLNSQTSRYVAKITKTPIQLIPNFISEEELAVSHDIRDKIETVLYVGGLVENKGAYDVLDIAKRFPKISFHLVGKGDHKFEEYAIANNISNAVFWGQKEPDWVRSELKQADVFLFMTYFRGEGFSNALCEAMAAGLPCIVTDWAANADMIGNCGGYVVPVKDVDAAAKCLVKMQDKNLRRSQSIANIEKVKNKYLEQIVVDKYVEAYNSLL